MAETRVYKMLASKKDPDLDGAIQLALADEETLRKILEGVVEEADAKGQILEFAERQLESSSPKARKAARAFLTM